MQMKLLLSATLIGLQAAFPALAQTDKQIERASAWKARLTEHIAGNTLLAIEGRGQAGHAKVTFVIDRSGKLKSRTLVESTGSRQLDVALVAIFDHAQPFPEPPSELTEDMFSFTVPLVFAGRHFDVVPYGLAASVPTPAFAASDAMDAWRNTVTEQVWRNRMFPPDAIGQRANAGVTFVIDRSGKLISNALVESTGFAPLDAATLAMVERSAPFPKPPAGAPDDLQRMTVLMTFDGTPPGQSIGWSWTEDEAKIKAKLKGVCRGC
ncbi:TonB family protein [Bradyrhizobium rifense]|uniref:TonB family protein n=1 Tax=Bradyrhizobium rifense TaxID=515499 RepID=A0A5D3K7R6_9BRAD|nr:TonB family protein [Bradyrhizobium rifense]TYL91992.1 TonB family protein [Bradyrhizobium rifense]